MKVSNIFILFKIALIYLFSSAYANSFDLRDVIEVPDSYIRDIMTDNLSEIECLALNIYHEARGEDLLGQQLVAQVTMNRADHEGFPDTICGVVRQDRQFSWTHDNIADHPSNRTAYENAYFISISFLLLDYDLDVGYSELILNYHASRINPGWSDLRPIMVYGSHVFYVRKRDLDWEK